MLFGPPKIPALKTIILVLANAKFIFFIFEISEQKTL